MKLALIVIMVIIALVCLFLRVTRKRKDTINTVIYLALEHGVISRGKACEALNIERCDLDEWIEGYRKRHGIGRM